MLASPVASPIWCRVGAYPRRSAKFLMTWRIFCCRAVSYVVRVRVRPVGRFHPVIGRAARHRLLRFCGRGQEDPSRLASRFQICVR